MSSSMKNITVSLLLITLAVAGYYFFVQKDKSGLEQDSMALTQDMMVNTQIFMERRNTLDKTTLDTEIFSNPVFKSYRSFNEPILEEPVGRANPFGRTNGGSSADGF